MSIILFKQKHNECFLYVRIEYDVCRLKPVRWIKVCQVRWTLKSVFGQVLKALNYMMKVNTSLHPTHQREGVTTEYLCEVQFSWICLFTEILTFSQYFSMLIQICREVTNWELQCPDWLHSLKWADNLHNFTAESVAWYFFLIEYKGF